MFRPQNCLDRVFEIGIIGKGLNGALEIVRGLLLLFLTPDRIHHVLATLTQAELSEDPGDFIATRPLFDAVIAALTWREYRQQRRIRAALATTSPTSAAHNGSGPRCI